MTTRAAIFNDASGPSFEEEWPELARRLERFLASKGVEIWLRADVVQETGARVYRKWSSLDRSRQLWNLVVTIALGVVVDEARKASRVELVPDVPESQVDDVEARALHRLHLVKTRAALNQLRTDQRRVLLAEIGEHAALDAPRNRINVLRLRARARLREALGPWVPSAIAIRLRYLRARVAQERSTLEMHVPAMANSLVNAALTATLGLAGVAGASVDADNFVSSERAPLLALAEPRVLSLDALVSTRNPESPHLSRAKDGARKNHNEARGVVANPGDTAAGLGEWANRRQREVGDRGEEVGNLAKDGRNLAEDGGNVGEEWVHGRQKEAGARKAEMEDRGEEVGDRGEEVTCVVPREGC